MIKVDNRPVNVATVAFIVLIVEWTECMQTEIKWLPVL